MLTSASVVQKTKPGRNDLLKKAKKQHILHALFRFPSKIRTLPLLFGIMRLILFEIVVILFLKNRKVGAAV